MRALVFKDFGSVELADVPKPGLEAADDALVRITTTAIRRGSEDMVGM